MTPNTDELVERLTRHRTLGGAPRAELEWVATRGHLRHVEAGQVVTSKTGPVAGLFIVLSGQLVIYVDRGTGPHRVMEWREGDVTGLLPYSRLVAPPGDVKAEVPSDLLVVPREDLPALVRQCEELTAILVHVMLDRARHFTTTGLQDEKVLSLGRMAAGLAHELNNPTSAIARSAETLKEKLSEIEDAALALGSCALSDTQRDAISQARQLCHQSAVHRTPLERSDREERFADWLDQHGMPTASAEALVDATIELPALDRLSSALGPDVMPVALRWLIADCVVGQLASEIQIAASRVHDLVAAVKGFSYMDQATMPKPVDLRKGLADTVMVLGSKAKSKSRALKLELPGDLPHVLGLGGALNQVWANILDNALDAARSTVTVTASADGSWDPLESTCRHASLSIL